MTTPLTIVANIQALPGHESAVEAALLALVEPTVAETGCHQYDLHRDLQTPGLFLFYENWATREDWDAHNQSDHIAALGKVTEGKIANPVILQMVRIDP